MSMEFQSCVRRILHLPDHHLVILHTSYDPTTALRSLEDVPTRIALTGLHSPFLLSPLPSLPHLNLTMSLTLAPSSPKVLAILRDRLESLLEVCRSGGFAHEQMLKLRLAEISVEGVEMVGEDDTVRTSPLGSEEVREKAGGWQLNAWISSEGLIRAFPHSGIQ